MGGKQVSPNTMAIPQVDKIGRLPLFAVGTPIMMTVRINIAGRGMFSFATSTLQYEFIGKRENRLGYWPPFMTEPDVDSTNNRSERSLPEQVILRKIHGTFRTRTEKGTRIYETIMTMMATCEQRGFDLPTLI